MNLLEETLSDIENCGYATGDVLYVGGEDGRVQMTWGASRTHFGRRLQR